MKPSLLWPTWVSKVPPPNTMTLGIRASTCELFGDTNIHSIKLSETLLHKRQINYNKNKTHTHWKKKKCVKTKLFRILKTSQGLQQYEQCLFTKNLWTLVKTKKLCVFSLVQVLFLFPHCYIKLKNQPLSSYWKRKTNFGDCIYNFFLFIYETLSMCIYLLRLMKKP